MKRKKSECKKQFHKNNRMNYTLAVFTCLMLALTELIVAYVLQALIEAVELKDGKLFMIGGILFLVYIISYGIFGALQRTYRNAYIQKALEQFKDYVFEKILGKSIAQFGEGTSAKFLSAFSNDLNNIETNYLAGSLNLIITIFSFTGAAAVMLFNNWMLALPIIIVSVIFTLISMAYGKKLVVKEAETSEENIGFVGQVKDLLTGFIIIKSFKAEKEVLRIFKKKNIQLESTKQGKRMTADTVDIFANISSMLVFSLTCVLGFVMAFRGHMTLGKVVVFIQLTNYLVTPIRSLAPQLSSRRGALGLIERISQEVEREEDMGGDVGLDGFHERICFKDVHFAYEEEAEVLKDINVTFEKGKSYAIVGGSGSGKSTLFKLMLGHHRNYQGELTLDGKHMNTLDLDSLYNQMTVIQQDVFLFDSTLKDNITMFREFDGDKLNSAVNRAGLDRLLVEKGDTYSCGEGGKNLSGGEKQRISIARCLIRETPILLMDEATAALDNNTALMVESAILDIKDLTRIIITHRFHEQVLNKYDEILVMHKGNIVERGNYVDLMEQKGYFYSLYNVAN